MGLGQVLQDFANWSTVCGVPHIANARTRAWRIFWSVIFSIMVAVFIYQLYIMIVKFLSFPSIVNTEIFYKEQDFLCGYRMPNFAIHTNISSTGSR
ncbi:hypothetical protein COOONC_18714 [Cooperia oncophora]